MSYSSGELKVIQFNPGINRNETSYENEATFIDGDKIRFRFGKVEKMKGWTESILEQKNDPTNTKIAGVPRAIKSFVDLQSNKYICLGTHKKLEMISSGVIYDITPLTTITTVTNAITTSIGSTDVRVSFPGHSVQPGYFVVFDNQGVSAGNNVVLSGEYTVTSVVDASNFIVNSGVTAAATSVSAGGSLEISVLYGVGEKDAGAAAGYGAGTYGTPGVSGYGEPRIGSVPTKIRTWTLDTWGEDILAAPRDGPLVHWDATNGLESALINRSDVRASIVGTAPATNTLMFVSAPERHVVLLGTEDILTSVFDPLLVRWSDRENYAVWTPTSTNAAGDFRLTGGSKIIGYVKTKRENLLFTDKSVFSMQYINAPFYYKFSSLSNNANLIAPHAGTEVDGVVYWMGTDAFYYYDGVVKRLPCSLYNYYFDESAENYINYTQSDKIFCGVNKTYNEIIWFLPTNSSLENNRYIIYNYVEKVWYDGTIVRTTWEPSSVFEQPLATFVSSGEEDSSLFNHNVGVNDGSNPMESYIQTGFFDIADGDDMMFISQFIPDFTIAGTLRMTVEYRKAPFDDASTKGPYTISESTPKVNVRARGREISLRFESDGLNNDFRFGKLRINPMPDGKR